MKRKLLSQIGRIAFRMGLLVVLLLAGPMIAAVSGYANISGHWSTASRESAGLAPDPAAVREPVVQVYGARAYGWRGAFAVHSWISVKRRDAAQFTTYEVIGWHHWRGRSSLVQRNGQPDRRWFGSLPEVYADLRGPGVEEVIDRIEAAIKSYPFANSYRTWPGPNSNTFTATIARLIPELRLDLPPTAIGKDYLGTSSLAAASPSGTGYQMSMLGLFGLLVGIEEGLEISILGLSFGLDPMDLALKLPGLGRLGGNGFPRRRLPDGPAQYGPGGT